MWGQVILARLTFVELAQDQLSLSFGQGFHLSHTGESCAATYKGL